MIHLPKTQPILVVDDDDCARLIMSRVLHLSQLQNEVFFFQGGSSVLLHMEEVEAGQQPMPSLILMDVNMPGLTGFEVLTTIRASAALATQPVVIMLTSSEADHDKEQALKSGANAFMEKQSGLQNYVDLFNKWFINSGP